MTRFAAAIAVGLGAVAALGSGGLGSAAAQTSEVPARPVLLQSLLDCRDIVASDARLACFDGAAAAFDTAERQGEVTVVDRAQAQETRTRLFGLNLGTANLFGGLRQDTPVEAIDTTLTDAVRDQNGKWIFSLADGSTWRQIDSERMSPRPRPGQTVRVRQGAINSYLLSVGGNRSVRARRES
jgi:hypothetical protein